ncbi:hypothetical protein CEXT_341861 [Caerostris extrusa]|uniref:Yippee domain-containing protein n=1 Tax=Caerostris extrusa TaxID=172846 RepID=A0AAV4MSA5_CAEEX|nr:hypothetical protein CEXT_341861 [Caerostris extrusa]
MCSSCAGCPECLSLTQRIQRHSVFLQILDAHHDFLHLSLAGDEFGVLQPFRLLLLTYFRSSAVSCFHCLQSIGKKYISRFKNCRTMQDLVFEFGNEAYILKLHSEK